MPHSRSAGVPPGRWFPWPSLSPSLLPLLAAVTAICLPLASAQKSAADYFVHSLPGAPEPLLKQYAGHIEVDAEHHGNLFFWLYKNRHIANRQRTVLWLNGGPGCSSMDGALMEIGPYRVLEGGNLTYNNGSWDEFANVLFVDNPVGTGFSYVDSNSYVHELDEMAKQMVSFLEKFFTLFPEHASDDLYIAGESYAGQHIPYIASAILDRNALNKPNAWNLSGLLIGNGWISGPEQYLSYIPFAYETGLVTAGSEQDRQLLEQQKECVSALDTYGKDHVDVSTCEAILQDLLRVSIKDGNCVNMYDVRLTDSYPSCGMNWPPDLTALTPYLRRPDVLEALHINPDKKTGWEECSGQVSTSFKAAQSKPSIHLLPDLLARLPILLFSGDQDLICNHLGTESLISTLTWNNATGFETDPGHWAPKRDWTFEDEPAGLYQSARNLTYVRFYNSSHMVPFDYPRRTRDMLDRFMGVDIASIGGTPADSRLDGEKAAQGQTSVAQNATLAQEAEEEKVSAAKWTAYRRAGEAALVFMVLVGAVWGYFVWRARSRRQRGGGYASLFGAEPYEEEEGGGLGLNGSARGKYREERDVEEAREYDEAELDDLGPKRRRDGEAGQGQGRNLEEEHFDVGDDESDEEDGRRTRG